jgi:hypothetical protein
VTRAWAVGRSAGNIASAKLFERPQLHSFLDFLLKRFRVGVWSTAMNHNVRAMAQHVFGADYEQRLAFVMDQSHCTPTGLFHWEEVHKPVYPSRPHPSACATHAGRLRSKADRGAR